MQDHPVEDASPEIMEMARHACAAFRRYTEFLVQGKMLATAALEVPSLPMTINGLSFGWPRPEIQVPAVVHKLWQAPSGKKACMLANISGETQPVRLPAVWPPKDWRLISSLSTRRAKAAMKSCWIRSSRWRRRKWYMSAAIPRHWQGT